MKKLESTLPNMVIVLTTVALVSAGLLGLMQQLTKDPIALIEKQTLENGIKSVMLDGQDAQLSVANEEVIEKNIDGDNYTFTVYSASVDGKPIGRAVKTAVNGFSPDLTVLVGFDNDGNIKGYEILKHAETPGLGAKADSWFKKGQKGDIIGKNPGTNNLTVSKDGGEVDAITASTITSRAFLKAVNAEYKAIFDGAKSASQDAISGATKVSTPSDSTSVAPADSVAVQ